MGNLKKAKKMLDSNKLDDDLFMRIYPFATENVNGYMNYFDFKNKSLLTVGSSGDQILNAYNKGCRDITLIDVNPFAPYYIYLKIAGILSLDYQEFMEFFFKYIGMATNCKRYNIELFNKLSNNLKSLDYESYYFFNEIFNKYSREKISDYLMNDDENNHKIIKEINNYLYDEKSYNKTKKILKDICFKYINQDMFKFNSDLRYDNIFLSNICTYVNIFELKDLIRKLNDKNLNNYGSILFAYLWNTDYNSNEWNPDIKDIYKMHATRNWLKEYITEHHQITGIHDIIFTPEKKSDLVLIYRK